MHAPEENAECVDVDAVVVFAAEELGRHVYGRADDAARHHRFRLAEAQVGDESAILSVQLKEKIRSCYEASGTVNYFYNLFSHYRNTCMQVGVHIHVRAGTTYTCMWTRMHYG